MTRKLIGALLALALLAPVSAELRRYRVQLEIMRQGVELLDQRSFWVQESVPRPLELSGLPEGTRVSLSATREVGSESLIVYFQVVAPPEAGYRELTSPRLPIAAGAAPPAFCFALAGEVYRVTVTSVKLQVLE